MSKPKPHHQLILDYPPTKAIGNYKTWPADTAVVVQEKLRGIRALFDGHHFYSRNGIHFTSMDYEPLIEAAKKLKETCGKCHYLDGELYHHELTQQDINSIVKSAAVHDFKSRKLYYHVYDYAAPIPYSERHDTMLHHTREGREYGIGALLGFKAKANSPLIMEEFNEVLFNGGEGLIIRRLDQPFYVHGTDHSIAKLKNEITEEGICVATITGAIDCKNSNLVSTLVVRRTNGRSSKVAGLTDALRAQFTANPPLNQIIQFKYTELTAHGNPLHPRFVAIRPDND